MAKLMGIVRVGHIKTFEYQGLENGQQVPKKGIEIRGYIDRFVNGQKVGEAHKIIAFGTDAENLEKYLTVGRNLYIEAVPQYEEFEVSHSETFTLDELKAVVAEMEKNGEKEKTLTFPIKVRQTSYRMTSFQFCDSGNRDNAPAKSNAPATAGRRWGNAPASNGNAPARSQNAPVAAQATATNTAVNTDDVPF